MAIDPTSTVTRSDTCMMAPLDNEMVVVSLASNAYLALDEIGRRVWELLETPQRVDALCTQLAEEFDADPEQILADVLPFLHELEREGVLNVASPRPA